MITAAGGYSHLAEWTRYQRASTLRRLLRILEESGAPRGLAAFVPKVVPPAPRATTATSEERKLILTNAPADLRCWLLLCSDLAMRSNTAARVTPNHYDPDRREVTMRTKFGNAQILPVTDELAAMFASVSPDADRATPYVLLLDPLRSQVSRSTAARLRQRFWRLRKRLGITKHLIPHDLRRTTAVRTFEATGDLRLVQALLGHRNLAQTLHYLDHRATPVPVGMLEEAKLNTKRKVTP